MSPDTSDRPFRFGVVAGSASTAQAWTAIARRVEELGYATLLVPDTGGTLAPFAALAAAATVTRTLRVGTYVLSVPNRTPGATAAEAASLDLLSGGRFELGVGAGRPGAEMDAARLGVPFGGPGERVRRLLETIQVVKQEVGDGWAVRPVQRPHPPILVAGSGPRVLRLAAREADTVALAVPAHSPDDVLAGVVGTLRDAAGSRFDYLEVAAHLAAVAEDLDELPSTGWLADQIGGDVRAMAANGGTGFLVGKPEQMADTLRRRRDLLGISYVTVGVMHMEQLAPVVELLAGS